MMALGREKRSVSDIVDYVSMRRLAITEVATRCEPPIAEETDHA
jgi:hypothetical protein